MGFRTSICCLAFTCWAWQSAFAERFYVNYSASAGGDGTSWGSAYRYLQDALDRTVSGRGDEIWLSAGTYFPDDGSSVSEGDTTASFLIKDGVTLYGGFAGGETQLSSRNWTTNLTILSGESIDPQHPFYTNSHHVCTVEENASVTLDGLTITGGRANGVKSTVNGVVQYDNTVSGAVYSLSPYQLTAINCTFSDNRAGEGGVANGGNWTVTNSTFSNNSAGYGGVAYYGDWTVANCSFIGNSAGLGGGVSQGGNWTVTDSSFTGNSAEIRAAFTNELLGGEGGVANDGVWVVTNCSFMNNSAGLRGGVAYYSDWNISGSSFDGNTSPNGGVSAGGTWEVDDCSFNENSASGGGGVDYQGYWTVSESTFTNNSASSGGVSHIPSNDYFRIRDMAPGGRTWVVSNCVFEDNSASTDGGVSSRGHWNVQNSSFNRNSATNGGVASYGAWTINDVELRSNAATDGGVSYYSNWSVTNSTFEDNSAIHGGGVDYVGSWSVSGSDFLSNSAGAGGVSSGSNWTVHNCRFGKSYKGNHSDSGGVGNGGNWTVTRSIFEYNYAKGGGVAVRGTWNVTNSIFNNNAAFDFDNIHSEDRGGVAVFGAWTATNCLFINNSARSGGVSMGAGFDVTNCTFKGNSASYGAIDQSGYWNLKNSIVDSTNLDNSGRAFRSITFTLKSLTILQGGAAIVSSNITGSGYLIDGNPLFVNAQDANGPDNIFGTADDGLRLQPSSPAIGQGDDTYLPQDSHDLDNDGDTSELLPIDISGFLRIQGSGLDLGAYEFASDGGVVNNSPIFTSPTNYMINEGTTAVGQVTATDADGDTISYSIVTGSNDAALFSINPSTGALSFLSAPTALENDQVYTLTVRASDAIDSVDQTITVTVLASNTGNTAPVFTSSANFTVNEGISTVGQVIATDADGDAVIYSLIAGVDAALFSIDASTGSLSFLSPPSGLTDDQTYSLTVSASDTVDSAEQSLTVTVQPPGSLNAAPVFTSSANFTLIEGISTVGQVIATDADGDTISYSIVNGNDADLFTINSSTGALSFLSAPMDLLSNQIYSLVVRAADQTESVDQTITVTVLSNNTTLPTPVISYPLNGDTLDVSGGGYHAELLDNAAFTTDRFGNPNNAVLLNGTTDRLALLSRPENVEDNFTYSVWVKPTVTDQVDPQTSSGIYGIRQKYLIMPSNGGYDNAGFGFSVGTNVIAVYYHGEYFLPAVLVHTGDFSDWTHVAISVEDGVASLFVNGQFIKTGLATSRNSIISTSPNIGGGVYGSYVGSIDEFKRYNSTLTSSQIAAIYANESVEPNDLEYYGTDLAREWISSFGLTGTDAQLNADPDGDGLINLFEYHLGTDPTNPDTDDDGLPDLEIPEVIAWGDNQYGQSTIPNGLNDVVDIAVGSWHTVALLGDGQVVAWGLGSRANVPAELENAVAISAGWHHSLALDASGRVYAWGENYNGQCNVPSAVIDAVAISAGGSHSMALLRDGSVVAWGQNTYGQCNVPESVVNAVSIAAGVTHSFAILRNGTVIGWGDPSDGRSNVPTSLVDPLKIVSGGSDNRALLRNGKVLAWGAFGGDGLELDVDAVDISRGNFIQLKGGSVISWNSSGVSEISNATTIFDIEKLHTHTVAFTSRTSPLNIDTDGDGILDGIEARYAAFGFDPVADSSGALAAFQDAARELPGVLKLEQGSELKLGGLALNAVEGSNMLSLDFVIEVSGDLQNWSKVDDVNHNITPEGGKIFMRVRSDTVSSDLNGVGGENEFGGAPLGVDSDDDGIPDEIEEKYAEYGFDPLVDSSELLSLFQGAAGELPGVLNIEQLGRLSSGGVALNLTSGSNMLLLNLIIEASEDLENWREVESVNHSISPEGGRMFMRVRKP